MSNIDISEAVISGATLTGVQLALYSEATYKGAAMNGVILGVSEAISQSLTSKASRGPVSMLLYGQHRNLTTAGLYAIVKEVTRMFSGGTIREAEWRAFLGNVFLALGSAELGRQINSGLGMAPGSVAVSNVAQAAIASSGGGGGSSVSNDYDNGMSNRGPPVVRSVYNV